MSRKNNIKKVAVAAVAAVSLALPFTSVCAAKMETSKTSAQRPKPDLRALYVQNNNSPTGRRCPLAPRKGAPVRRFNEINIHEARDLIVRSRRVNHALTTGDENAMDRLIRMANIRRFQRHARRK